MNLYCSNLADYFNRSNKRVYKEVPEKNPESPSASSSPLDVKTVAQSALANMDQQLSAMEEDGINAPKNKCAERKEKRVKRRADRLEKRANRRKKRLERRTERKESKEEVGRKTYNQDEIDKMEQEVKDAAREYQMLAYEDDIPKANQEEEGSFEILPKKTPVYLVVNFKINGEKIVSLITKDGKTNAKRVIDSVSLDGDVEQNERVIYLGSKDLKFKFILKPDLSIKYEDENLDHIFSLPQGTKDYPYHEHGFKLKVEMKLDERN